MTDGPAAFLAWGVRASLWNYVSRAGGTVTPIEPATIDGSLAVFPSARPSGADGLDHSTTHPFLGGLRFVAYGGMLTIEFESLQLERIDADDYALSAVSSSIGERFVLAAARRGAATRAGLVPFQAWLTPAGATIFGGSYPAGDALDPFTLIQPA